MLTVQEASHIVSEKMPKYALGSGTIHADRNYPPFDRVMMDGIAVKFEDYSKGIREFKIEGVASAGEPQKTLKSGCLEVMTGCPLPENSDLVIQYEHLKIENGMAKVIVESDRSRLDSVHPEGSDCKKGDVVLQSGHFMNGPHAGIAASMGRGFSVASPKVMIISTGNELVEDNPLPHEIRRSNAYALKRSMELYGFQDITLSHLTDDPLVIADHYKKHSDHCDIMIYSGGVSKGKFDYLPNVWTEMGVTKHFHEVSQRPGKPLWFGVDEKRKTTVIGLPGNPVSSLVCLHRYFLPSKQMTVKLTEDVKFNKPLTYFMPVKISFESGMILATPLSIKNSGEFTALAGSDGFIELDKDQDFFPKDTIVSFYPWRSI